MNNDPQTERFGVILRAGTFVLLAILGFVIFPLVLHGILGPGGYVITAALSVFGNGAVANAISLRVYERGRLSDIGLGWNGDSWRNLGYGVLGGVGAALCVIVLPILARYAELEPQPDATTMNPGSMIFLTIVLLFGAVGEEMLFRGYAFQVVAAAIGPFATLLPMGVLFGAAHMGNLNVTFLALFNTGLWGVLLGYAFIRSGDLWLPIGIHFGWNWSLPLLGVNMSGFTMNVTGYVLHWKVGDTWSGGEYGPEGGLLTTLVVIVMFFYLLRAPIRTQEAFLLREKTDES